MMRARLVGPGCAAAWLLLWGCSSSSAPPPLGTTGDDGGSVIDSSMPPVDSGGDSTLGNDTSTPQPDTGVDAEAGPPTLPNCRTTFTWSTTTARIASIASAGFARFGGISADELTVAWTDSTGAIFVADRSSPSGAFGVPGTVPTGTIMVAQGRVAVTPDGLELVATLADGSSFAPFVRVSRGASWQAGSSTQFKDLVAASQALGAGGVFSEPVIGADGLSLFYLFAAPAGEGGTALPVLLDSPWNQGLGVWEIGAQPSNADFANATSSFSQLRRPTGASDDGRTLFFFDGVAGHERAAWRTSVSAPWTVFADLPALAEAAPTSDCVDVYYSGNDADAGGPGLYVGSGP